MSPFTQDDIKTHLHDATTSKTRMKTYAKLLGIHKRSKSKSTTGRPAYRGKVKDFYNATKAIAVELAKKYDSLIELQKEIKTRENFTESLIDDAIQKYGPEIWNGFETVTDESDPHPAYPRHLIYNNESDRTRIRTFVYCFTLKSICHNMKNTGPQPRDDIIQSVELPFAGPRGRRVRRSTLIAPDIDMSIFEPTRTVPTTPTSATSSEDGCLQDTCEYRVPVAPMLPTVNTEDIPSSSTMPQFNTAGLSVATSNNFNATEDPCQPSEISHSQSLHVALSSLDQASNKTSRQREETNECPPEKRRKTLYGGAANTNIQVQQLSEFTGRSVPQRKGGTYNISRSTSPNVTSGVPHNSTDQSRRDISSILTTRHNPNEMTSVQCESRVDNDMNDDSDDDAIAVTSVTTLHIHTPNADAYMLDDSIREVDSVTDSPRPSPVVEEQNEEIEPTLIVKLRIQSQKKLRQRQAYRVRLAAKLPGTFEMSSEQPKVLEDVVKLIKSIRDLDEPLSRIGFGGKHASYQLVLDQWLHLVDIYLRFRNDPNFNDHPSTWDTHRKSLGVAERFRRDTIINVARADILDWSLEHDKHNTNEWSRCVTSTLLEMADWGLKLNSEEVEEIRGRFVKFNESLIKFQF